MTSYQWILSEGGHDYSTVEAETVDDALDIAASNVDGSLYDKGHKTFWVDVRARCEATGEEGEREVTVDPVAPPCITDDHDWQRPYRIVGGDESNPGVWSSRNGSGGVCHREVCMHCGCERVTDTWDTRPDTGQQGLRSICYTPGKYKEELEKAAKEDEEPKEPECTNEGHDWQQPHKLVGGTKEYPGIGVKGGGHITREVCMHCGCERVTDTWATDRVTGMPGVTTVTYAPGKHAAAVHQMADSPR